MAKPAQPHETAELAYKLVTLAESMKTDISDANQRDALCTAAGTNPAFGVRLLRMMQSLNPEIAERWKNSKPDARVPIACMMWLASTHKTAAAQHISYDTMIYMISMGLDP